MIYLRLFLRWNETVVWSGRRSGSAGHCSDPFPQECSYKRFATGLIGRWKAEISCRESPGQALGGSLQLVVAERIQHSSCFCPKGGGEEHFLSFSMLDSVEDHN